MPIYESSRKRILYKTSHNRLFVYNRCVLQKYKNYPHNMVVVITCSYYGYLLLLWPCFLVCAYDPCIQLPTSAGPTTFDFPLCGNGVLDPGEVCDDGSTQQGADGCNAWCTGFNKMTKTCTLAGQNLFYATNTPSKRCLNTMLSSTSFSPSQATFCNLNALGVSPDGSYLIVADGGLLVRLDLFTDNIMNSLSFLPATLNTNAFNRFCFLFILDDLDTVVAYECAQQKIVVFVNGGNQYSVPASLPFNPTFRARAYLNQGNGNILIAGTPSFSLGASPTSNYVLPCIQLYSFNTSSMEGEIVASIDCIAYNVIENGIIYPSFSLQGMVPYQVTLENCPALMNSVGCYVIYMDRSDMQILKAYVSSNGGTDIQFSVSTDNTANVLGSPLVFRSLAHQMTYSLTGNCFTAQNTVVAPVSKRVPPMTALGNTCGLLPFNPPTSAPCSMPLNNPFITNVASSSYLLPLGLSSKLQHQNLLQIFSNDTAGGGLPLYRQILDNMHNGTVPIDFVELPTTLDILYITQTTIGLISTKGIVFMDLSNPGFCRATQAILCPPGFFGSVGTVCKPCTVADQSVSAQIQCIGFSEGEVDRRRRRRNLLLTSSSSLQSPPYSQVGLIVDQSVTKIQMDMLTSYYLVAKGFPCGFDSSAMTAHQPYNLQADYSLAQVQPPARQLIPELVSQATTRNFIDYTQLVADEYLVEWSSSNTTILYALSTPSSVIVNVTEELFTSITSNNPLCGLSPVVTVLLDDSPCRFLINRDFHRIWLPCAIQVISSSSSLSNSTNNGGRHLLQQQQGVNSGIATENSQFTFMSSTSVSYGSQSPSTGGGGSGTRAGDGNNNNSNSNNGSFIVIALGIGAGIIIVILLLIIIYYCLFISGKHHHYHYNNNVPTQEENFKLA